MVMLDDLNPHDGRLWSAEIMPNLHELVLSQGIRFTDFHAEVPLCGPSRANLLTGQHAHNSGAASNDGQQLDPTTTIATELSGAGYHTSFVGKYLNGYRQLTPDRRDPPGWSAFDVIDSNQGKYFWYQIRDSEGGVTQHRTDEADYSTDVIADIAVARLAEAPADQPLFSLIAPFTPHEPNLPAPRHAGDARCLDLAPWAPPDYDEADVSDKPAYIQDLPALSDGGFDLTAHCESLLAVDDLVGRVGDELRRQGRLDDTVFVFTADNGMTWGEHRRVGKTSPYSTAVPAYAAWPAGRGTTPREDDTTLSMIDWAPTLCDLAGCEMGPYPDGQPASDGLSFAPLLSDAPYPNHRESVLHTIPSGGDRPVFWSLRTTADHPDGEWLYVENEDGFRELYDLVSDPSLLTNRLAGEPGLEAMALGEALAAELAAKKLEVAPEPVVGLLEGG
jgi:arylsulfatase A-like enzyme